MITCGDIHIKGENNGIDGSLYVEKYNSDSGINIGFYLNEKQEEALLEVLNKRKMARDSYVIMLQARIKHGINLENLGIIKIKE